MTSPQATGTASGDLHQRVVDRITVLRHELQIGETRLHDIEREEAMLRQTVLRISGAIQALEEVLGERVTP